LAIGGQQRQSLIALPDTSRNFPPIPAFAQNTPFTNWHKERMMNWKWIQSNGEGFVMAFPKPAFLVVDGLASGPGPPWFLNFTFTWSLPRMGAKRTGVAKGGAP
jgi:hypothetical protein